MAKHYSKQKAEVRAQWRRRAREELQKRGEPADFSDSQPGDGDLDPPDAKRVARRACCLGAVALRGLAGTWDHADQVEFLPKLRNWFESTSAFFEIEKEELEVIQAPPSELDERSMINACWRWEGVAVLAAAIGLHPLPPHDQTVNTETCGKPVGLLVTEAELAPKIENAKFDPAFDRFAYANRALAIHWRLRQATHFGRKPLDFAAFAKGVEWAQFNIDGVPLASKDLAIEGEPISTVSDELLGKAMSIASERHIAANWLIGWSELYSEVDNPT